MVFTSNIVTNQQDNDIAQQRDTEIQNPNICVKAWVLVLEIASITPKNTLYLNSSAIQPSTALIDNEDHIYKCIYPYTYRKF
jgi:hypothetical protein